jgi:hypothetical protein
MRVQIKEQPLSPKFPPRTVTITIESIAEWSALRHLTGCADKDNHGCDEAKAAYEVGQKIYKRIDGYLDATDEDE